MKTFMKKQENRSKDKTKLSILLKINVNRLNSAQKITIHSIN